MDATTPRPQAAFPAAVSFRKKGPLAPLRIDTPQPAHNIVLASPETSTSASALSSATSDTESFHFPSPTKPRSKNMKRLSLTLPSAQSSTNSLLSPLVSEPPTRIAEAAPIRRRRPSIISLPNASTSSILHRKDEDAEGEDSSAVPYANGPIQIIPGIWLGNEDNARDWRGLIERGIKSVLNVAKEVTCPFDGVATPALRSTISTPNLKNPAASAHDPSPTYFPAHVPSGRPGMHYLQLPWSHGQSDLVSEGFPAAMAFVDRALGRGDGVLIHCQCGVSRSATLVIALVMRAAAQCSPQVPPEVWAIKGMQGAYSFVKEKSKHVGPNMSLIYQLLDYERTFKPNTSPSISDQSSMLSEEEEWARRRQSMDETDTEDNERESVEVMREAQALDKAMEHRRISRKSSMSSTGSTTGLGMGQAWRHKYGSGRKRAGSIASIVTTGSILSEHLVEEDEEQELLGVGGGFAEASCSSAEPTEDEASTNNPFADNSQESSDLLSGTPNAQRRSPGYVPPSAPAHKSSFNLPAVPATATAATFNLSKPKSKPRKRPPPLFGLLPPVPPSPVTPVSDVRQNARSHPEALKPELRIPSTSSSKSSSKRSHHQIPPPSATPAQTLFVFPPSPTLSATTPCTLLTITSSSLAVPPSATTPRVSNMRAKGRPRSFIGLGVPATPTTACSRVDARGWIGLH